MRSRRGEAATAFRSRCHEKPREAASGKKGQRRTGEGRGQRGSTRTVSATPRRRLQLGIQGCVGWGHGETDSFSVSMSRSANKESGHTHTVSVSLKDDNVRACCLASSARSATARPSSRPWGAFRRPGETGTTRRDSCQHP